MSYYEEKLQNAKAVANLAAQGFINEVREIAEALSVCGKDDAMAISEHLSHLVEVMKSVEDNVKYYRDLLEKENKE